MTTQMVPRVLMFVPQYPNPVIGGLEKQSHELSQALLSLGVSVQVLSGKIYPNQPEIEHVDGVLVTRMPWAHWKPWRFIRGPLDILALLWRKRASYDLIHLHQYSWVGLYVILIAKVLSKPIITKLPNVRDHGIPGLILKPLGKWRLAILLRSDCIVAMSSESVLELLAVGYPLTKILQVPNGIRLQTRAQILSGRDEFFCRVVFVGRLSEEKRLDVLLAAWQRVSAKVGDQAVLELWGEGSLAESLDLLCRQLGLSSSVRFLGHVVDVRERLSVADVFALPSHAEGNSNAVLEAMEAGLPIVATSVGGTPMQVGVNGAPLLFNVGDSDALAERLLMLIQDPNLRRSYGDAMRRRIQTYFNIDKVAAAYLCAYRKLAYGGHVNIANCSQLPNQ